MPLWSLTRERVEKLLRQVGDKEMEIDKLIALSKEDMWTQDLDAFIAEWRFQLEDEERREKKIRGMGRRVSSKLPTEGKGLGGGKKRKALGDNSDDDYAAPKSKKAATSKKAEPKGKLMDSLKKPPARTTAKPAITIDSDDEMDFDGEDSEEVILTKKNRGDPKSGVVPKVTSDKDEFFDAPAIREPPKKFPIGVADEPVKPTSNPAAANKPLKKSIYAELSDSASEDDDDLLNNVSKMVSAKPESNHGKAAIKQTAAEKPEKKAVEKKPVEKKPVEKKPVKYTGFSDSESDNGDVLLDDVSKMVKGIGAIDGATTSADSRTLFSERSRPGSSAGLKSTKKVPKASSDFDPDETDYSKLIPQNSPRRSLLVKNKDVTIIEDQNTEDEESVKPKSKVTTASKATAKSTMTKARGRAKGDSAKGPVTAPATKKTKPSPAAKAYAAKKSKTAKKILDDSDDDIDAMANDILDSPGGGNDSDAKPSRGTRPSRRAAATKRTTYVIDDDSDELNGDIEDDFSESD